MDADRRFYETRPPAGKLPSLPELPRTRRGNFHSDQVEASKLGLSGLVALGM